MRVLHSLCERGEFISVNPALPRNLDPPALHREWKSRKTLRRRIVRLGRCTWIEEGGLASGASRTSSTLLSDQQLDVAAVTRTRTRSACLSRRGGNRFGSRDSTTAMHMAQPVHSIDKSA
jgi:hypothetical protein